MAHKLRHLSIVLVLVLGGLVLAEHRSGGSEPDGCPPPFHLHTGGHHPDGDGHAHHRHVGVDDNRNETDEICGFHVGVDEGIHVHTDDNDTSP